MLQSQDILKLIRVMWSVHLVQETVKSSPYVRPQYVHFESLLVK